MMATSLTPEPPVRLGTLLPAQIQAGPGVVSGYLGNYRSLQQETSDKKQLREEGGVGLQFQGTVRHGREIMMAGENGG